MELEPIRFPDALDVVVRPQLRGTLVCSQCGNRWCDHAQRVVTQGLDAHSVWKHGMYNDSQFPCEVAVPLMPATYGLWVRVALEKVSDSALRATVTAPLPRDPNMNGYSPLLGFISEGEGRMVLRRMIVDWFEPLPGLGSSACGNLQHSTGTSLRLSNALATSDGTVKLANDWTVFHFQQCVICMGVRRRQRAANQAPGQQQFPPDLIPQM